MSAAPEPVSLTLAPQALTLLWGDAESSIAAAALRAHCRCAACQATRLRGLAPAPDAAVTLVDAVPVGRYAVQLRFSDGHDRGIYPWAWLRELAGQPR